MRVGLLVVPRGFGSRFFGGDFVVDDAHLVVSVTTYNITRSRVEELALLPGSIGLTNFVPCSQCRAMF